MKNQPFYILKFQSSRLKDTNFKIKNITIDEARLNGEVISISNSEMVRTIQRVTHKKFSQQTIDELVQTKKSLSKRRNSKGNRSTLTKLMSDIDEYLFMPEIISVYFDDKRHFQNILDGGFYVNGKTYVPFMASAGMIRRDTSLFIESQIWEQVDEIFNNNRNRDVEIVPAKFLAYYSLYSSSTVPIPFPRIAIVPDLTITAVKPVDFSTYKGVGIDPLIEEMDMELEFNAFDGQGLCSPAFAKTIKDVLQLPHVPSTIGIRAPYLKGMMCVFDFHEFSREIAKKAEFIDIYGKTCNINDVDCIVSESQFKLWSSYSSTEEYLNACSQNQLGFGVTSVNRKNEKNHAKTSYQFLQILNLTDEDVESLCKPTVEWLNDVSSGDLSKTLLYLLGETDFSVDGWFDRLDVSTQAVLLNNTLIEDPHFRKQLHRSINKKKTDAKIGRLILNGNYQVLISDPYGMAGHVFGMGINPLLQDEKHFSHYWNTKGISQVAGIRSPIVHSSEVNVLNLQDNDDVNHWYKHIRSGIIVPMAGVGMDGAILGGADYDLDLICTIHSPEIIKGRVKGYPVMYDTVKASKVKLDSGYHSLLHNSQLLQIKTNKIGFLTNVSSALYSLLYDFEEGSDEHTAILQRLKYGRVSQGLAIDSTKGIETDPFPEHFVKWKKITDDMTEDEKELQEFYNRILAEKRPYFMRWLYPHYNRRYVREISGYDNISRTKWGMSFDELWKVYNPTEEQQVVMDSYKKRTFFINNNSTMNRVSKHVDKSIKQFAVIQRETNNFDFTVLLAEGKKVTKFSLDKAGLLYKEWKSLNKSFRDSHNHSDLGYESLEQIDRYINKRAYDTITVDPLDMGNIMATLCYRTLGVQSRGFLWRVFGREVLENMKSKRTEKFVRVPMYNEKGTKEYLWSKYGNYLLNLEIE